MELVSLQDEGGGREGEIIMFLTHTNSISEQFPRLPSLMVSAQKLYGKLIESTLGAVPG